MSRYDTPAPRDNGAPRTFRARDGRTSADGATERADGRRTGRREASGRRAPGGPRPQGTLPMQPPAHYEPYLDGLFTYALSLLREQDAAAGAVGEVLSTAERQRVRLRDPGRRRPWLYALARWTCLRRLAGGRPAEPRMSGAVAAERRSQLASLAWPEAVGTTPEQREALELAVRHQLPVPEVALVLGLEPDAARTLLARAACEVERTHTALAVVDTGRCAGIARLGSGTRALLGPALRAEFVRHVDDCAVCRGTAERVVADGPWPGAADAASVLALAQAPRSGVYAAMLHAMDTGFGRTRETTPRFDRHGFPVDPGRPGRAAGPVEAPGPDHDRRRRGGGRARPRGLGRVPGVAGGGGFGGRAALGRSRRVRRGALREGGEHGSLAAARGAGGRGRAVPRGIGGAFAGRGRHGGTRVRGYGAAFVGGEGRDRVAGRLRAGGAGRSDVHHAEGAGPDRRGRAVEGVHRRVLAGAVGAGGGAAGR